jgi:hypothetical protein
MLVTIDRIYFSFGSNFNTKEPIDNVRLQGGIMDSVLAKENINM